MTWLPADFTHPLRVELSGGHHLRPITGADAAMDHPVVMGSRERLWSLFGEAWGWPAATLTYEANRRDLERHEAEIAAHESFNYVLLDASGTVESGCVYVDPPAKAGADAEICWWVTDDRVGTGLERELDALVPRWIAEDWPFVRPRFIGRDLSWREWLALPDADARTGAGT
ncbi:N-acetyltransferase [Streptomyces sp. NPDC004528]|uniref:N-acetyltransferase n=1 Tax=Streptomyces sp. NPDC004528 TaxID=3154550 RepID=UPI0033AF8039